MNERAIRILLPAFVLALGLALWEAVVRACSGRRCG
jgi:hypothetical protein